MQVLMLSGESILFISRRLSNKGNEAVDPTFIHACQTPNRAVSPASLSLTSLTVTPRSCNGQVHVVEEAEYISQVREHHNKLFIVKLNMEIVLVFLKKDLNVIFKFIQPRETFAS